MKLSKIKANPNNPRVIKDERFNKLVKSIEEFPKMMELRPMVVDNENIVLGGNMRLRALQFLGFKEIPDSWVKRADTLTKEEQQRFIIADNVGFGDHDWDALNNDWDMGLLEDWGIERNDFDLMEDPELIIKSNDRGGMMQDGVKVVIGNFTRYVNKNDEIYQDAKDFEDFIMKCSTDEITEILCKIFKEYTS